MKNKIVKSKSDYSLLSETSREDYGSFKNLKINLVLKNFSIVATKHEKEREAERGIDKNDVIDIIEEGLLKILNDYFNGEIEASAEVILIDKSKALNVVCALDMKKGKDFFNLVTVMKKKNFHVKKGTYKYFV